MHFGTVDIIIFFAFIISVITIGILKSRKEQTGEDYFLAGRGLTWWLIGFSLIAANISTEQFVGMSGNAASHVGLAIASYEWMAAITLVVVAFGFLPYFLRAGIFTMPEFLEVRYNSTARTIMASATIFIYMLLLGSVTYAGAVTIRTLAGQMGYHVPLTTGSLIIGVIAMLYVAAGGLKACAWADLIQGSALIVGGAIIMVFAFIKLGQASVAAQIVNVETGEVAMKALSPDQGAVERFWDLNRIRMNMFLPKTDTILPWTALMLGLWIPNFYYWGLNQYITQRTLGSASLKEGQKGIVFAAALKLVIPFFIVIPGIIAFNLYSNNMQTEAIQDNAKIMAKYVMANPNTQMVEVAEAPPDSMIAAWNPDRFLIALYEDQEKMTLVRAKNPFVLPILKSDYAATDVSKYALFKSEDKAWKSVFPALAAEVTVYNANASHMAEATGNATSTEKFIAYKYDTAMAQLLGNVLPQGVGLLGFVLAALLGAVVSSLAAMLNASSTIFTMDIYKRYMAPEASQKSQVLLGRICVVAFAFIAITLAPQLGNPKISNSIFTIIQEGQGFISPGILAVFAFGLLVRKAPPMAGVVGLLTNIAAYGILKLAAPQIQFLNRMAICFALCLLVMGLITAIRPLPKPVEFKQQTNLNLETSKGALIVGLIVIALTLILYFIFSPLGLAK
ncbi:sodium/solute symporter [candidate division KSB1 bacterium]|nr:sodium/solute symporter [candidate division KSB1 bacterium]